MPITYNIDTERDLAELIITGLITEQEYCEHLAKIQADPTYSHSYNKLLDISNGSIDLSVEERYEFTKRMAAQYGKAKNRFAIIAKDPREIAHGMLFGTALKSNKARVFSTREAALEWLDTPAP